MEQLNAAPVLLAGPNFLEHVHALSTWIREVVMHGVRHGATLALAVAHLRSDANLRAVEPGFPPKLLDNVGDLTADFSAITNAIVTVVDARQVVQYVPFLG